MLSCRLGQKAQLFELNLIVYFWPIYIIRINSFLQNEFYKFVEAMASLPVLVIDVQSKE